MSRAGYRTKEPPELDFPKEEPHLLKALVDLHRDSLGYSMTDLANLLTLDPDEVVQIYPVTPRDNESTRHLRAI